MTLENKEENLNNEKGGANPPAAQEDNSQSQDKLLAELETLKKEKEALAKEKETIAKDLEKRIADLEKEKAKEAQNEIDKLVEKYVPFDKKTYSNLSKADKENHILKEVIRFEFDFSKLTTKERKSAIETRIRDQESQAQQQQSKDSAHGSTIASIFKNQSKSTFNK
jgi:hypothetical protein